MTNTCTCCSITLLLNPPLSIILIKMCLRRHSLLWYYTDQKIINRHKGAILNWHFFGFFQIIYFFFFFSSQYMYSQTSFKRPPVLTLKAPNKNKAWFFMWILHLAENSLETSSLIFSEKTMKKYSWTSSAAVVIGPLRVKQSSVL